MPLTAVCVTVDDVRRDLIHKLQEQPHNLPLPLLSLIAEYWTPMLPEWEGISYYNISQGYGPNINNVQMKFGMQKEYVEFMLENDHVAEIEMVQCGNMAGEYYRAFIRGNSRATFKSSTKPINPSMVFEIVPFDSSKKTWPLPFGGPNIQATKRYPL